MFQKRFGRFYRVSEVDAYMGSVRSEQERKAKECEDLNRQMLMAAERRDQALRETKQAEEAAARARGALDEINGKMEELKATLLEKEDVIFSQQNQAAEMKKAMAALQQDIRRQTEENTRIREEFASQVQAQEERILAMNEEIRKLKELESLPETLQDREKRLRQRDMEIEELNDQMQQLEESHQHVVNQARMLRARTEQQEKDLKEYEQILAQDPLAEANEKAEKIIKDAVTRSNTIISRAQGIQTRTLAATKAAYFNAMRFRQTLAEQFSTIEQELDQSLGILRMMETERLSEGESDESHA